MSVVPVYCPPTATHQQPHLRSWTRRRNCTALREPRPSAVLFCVWQHMGLLCVQPASALSTTSTVEKMGPASNPEAGLSWTRFRVYIGDSSADPGLLESKEQLRLLGMKALPCLSSGVAPCRCGGTVFTPAGALLDLQDLAHDRAKRQNQRILFPLHYRGLLSLHCCLFHPAAHPCKRRRHAKT